jgi:hypothetical protein
MGSDPDDQPDDDGLPGGADAHFRAAWRTWLSALATDAEAAMAAALAYESLPADGRDAWLDALDVDAPQLAVPVVALYAPLLAVEAEEARRERIQAKISEAAVVGRGSTGEVRAHRGVAGDGTHACVIVSPLYLDFVQVLLCRYTPTGGFVEVKLEPLRHARDVDAPREVNGVAVEPTPLRVVVEELAHAILADKRSAREAPQALQSFAHLFVPYLHDGHDETG